MLVEDAIKAAMDADAAASGPVPTAKSARQFEGTAPGDASYRAALLPHTSVAPAAAPATASSEAPTVASVTAPGLKDLEAAVVLIAAAAGQS